MKFWVPLNNHVLVSFLCLSLLLSSSSQICGNCILAGITTSAEMESLVPIPALVSSVFSEPGHLSSLVLSGDSLMGPVFSVSSGDSQKLPSNCPFFQGKYHFVMPRLALMFSFFFGVRTTLLHQSVDLPVISSMICISSHLLRI